MCSKLFSLVVVAGLSSANVQADAQNDTALISGPDNHSETQATDTHNPSMKKLNMFSEHAKLSEKNPTSPIPIQSYSGARFQTLLHIEYGPKPEPKVWKI